MNTKRENRLEELGRVDAEKAYTSKGKKNLREEKSRIRSELAVGGTVAREAGRKLQDKTRGGGARRPTTPEQKRQFRKRKPGGSMGPDYKQKPITKVITIADNRIPKGTKVFASADEKIHKKPHATKEGSWASIKRAAKRFDDKTYKIEDYGDKSLDIQWKAENKARKNKMAKGGSPKKPRPHGPHMWVRGEKRKKYASGGAVMSGKKVGCQIK